VVESPKDRLYEYVLSKGAVKFRRLEGAFDNARRLVLELVRVSLGLGSGALG